MTQKSNEKDKIEKKIKTQTDINTNIKKMCTQQKENSLEKYRKKRLRTKKKVWEKNLN